MPFRFSVSKHRPAENDQGKVLRCKSCNGLLAPFKT
jgi:hypothetical protein